MSMSFVFGIFGGIITLFLLMAFFLLKGKGEFLIAGYNTMNEEKRALYDKEALCRFVGWLLIVFSFAMALISVGLFLDVLWLTYCGSVFILVGSIGAIIYANTGKRFHRRDNDIKMSRIVGNKNSKDMGKTVKLLTIAISVIVLISVGGVLYYGTAAPVVEIFEDSLQIKAMYGVTIDFSDIAAVSLIEKSVSEIGIGSRVNGYGGFGGVLKGHFKSDNLGETLLFVNANSAPTIRIERNNEKDVYINFSNSEQTEILFNNLITAIT